MSVVRSLLSHIYAFYCSCTDIQEEEQNKWRWFIMAGKMHCCFWCVCFFFITQRETKKNSNKIKHYMNLWILHFKSINLLNLFSCWKQRRKRLKLNGMKKSMSLQKLQAKIKFDLVKKSCNMQCDDIYRFDSFVDIFRCFLILHSQKFQT